MIDADDDGIADAADACPNTTSQTAEEAIDENGCSPEQLDGDDDGVSDADDRCEAMMTPLIRTLMVSQTDVMEKTKQARKKTVLPRKASSTQQSPSQVVSFSSHSLPSYDGEG